MVDRETEINRQTNMGAWLFHQLAVCLMDNKRKKHVTVNICSYDENVLLLLFVNMTSTRVTVIICSYDEYTRLTRIICSYDEYS